LQKYEIWLQPVRQETMIGEAADQWEVDRSTIMRLCEVAKQGALAALAETRPGTRSKEHDLERAQAKAKVARPGEALKELAVKLLLVEGKGVGAEWPGPTPGRGGHQGRPAGPGRAGGAGRLGPPAATAQAEPSSTRCCRSRSARCRDSGRGPGGCGDTR
jgi:hypothetical protein